jgi:hypothetical protein
MNVFDKEGPIKCKDCTSTFATEGGLKIHRGWKHKESIEKKEPKKEDGMVEIRLSEDTVKRFVVYALEDIARQIKGKG